MPDEKRLFLSPPHMSGEEQKRIAEVFASNYIAPVGPHLAMFEEQFAAAVGMKFAVALASGTAAIHLALRQLNLQPGDDVLCSTFTFCASANPIRYEHANPVFIDCDHTSWNMDPNLLQEELEACDAAGRLPKAVIAVDLLGQSADMDAIRSITDRWEIPVIEDAAEALGGTYQGRPTGCSGWCSAFSFNGNKIITTSGGGMLCSDDEQVVEQARFLSTQARDPAAYYEHSTIGYNYRMSNVLAAIGLAQLDVLPQRVAAKKELFEFFQTHLADLPGISFMPVAEFGQPNYWLTSILVEPDEFGMDCEQLRQLMESRNLEARRVWKPMHCQPVFAGCRSRGGKVAEEIFAKGLSLPSGTAMTEEDRMRIVDAIRTAHRSVTA